jgi:hypothetical protein
LQITEMDSLAETIIKVKAEIAELEDQIDAKKDSIKDILSRVQEYFIETDREEPYRSPYGTLFLRKDVSVPMPKGEKLKALFDHFTLIYGADVAWEKMSIHNATLKSEIKDHVKAVEERGGDPILEPLPGVETPKTVKTLQFKRKL